MKKCVLIIAFIHLGLGVSLAPAGFLQTREVDRRELLEAFQRQLQNVVKTAGPGVVAIVVSRSEFYPPRPPDAPAGQLGAFDPREFIKGDASPSRIRLAKHLDLSDPQAIAEHGCAGGVVLDTSGLILTLYHVIEGARKIYVHTAQGGSYADIHAADARSDLAVLKLIRPPDGLVPIRFADVLLYDLPQRKATVAPGRLVVLLAYSGRLVGRRVYRRGDRLGHRRGRSAAQRSRARGCFALRQARICHRSAFLQTADGLCGSPTLRDRPQRFVLQRPADDDAILG